MMSPANPNGWSRYEEMVLHRLGQLDSELKEVESRLRKIEGRLWVLQTKAGMLGAISGAITAAVAFIIRGSA